MYNRELNKLIMDITIKQSYIASKNDNKSIFMGFWMEGWVHKSYHLPLFPQDNGQQKITREMGIKITVSLLIGQASVTPVHGALVSTGWENKT